MKQAISRAHEFGGIAALMSSTSLARVAGIAAAFMIVTTDNAAFAQTAPPTTAASPDAEVQETAEADIVVTALKREQRLIDVPATVSVLSEERIVESRIEQVEGLAATVSNVNVRQTVPGVSPVITIRGVGLDDFSTTNSPATGVSVDEVTLSSIALLNADFFDIGRVEVVKGPQGTLYGRNTVSGALNIISAKPINSLDAAASVGYGNYETFDATAMLNLPIADGLAVRLSGKTIQQGQGFYTSNFLANGSPGTRDVGRRNVFLGRAQIGYAPNADLSIVAKYEKQRVRSEMGQYKGYTTFRPGAPFARCAPNQAGQLDNSQCADAYGFSNANPDRFNIDVSRDVPYDVDQSLYSLNAKWTIGAVELTSVTGFIEFDRTYRIDVDTTPREQLDFIQRDSVEQFSQELRAATEIAIADIQVGAFYSYDRAIGDNDNLISEIPLVLLGFPSQNGKTTFDQRTRSAAAFGNVIWHLTDSINLTTGLRYTWEERDYVGGTSYPLCPRAPVNPLCAAFGIGTTFVDLGIDDKNWSWKVGIDYKFTADSLIYASVSKGTKSGGFVTRFTTTNNQLLPYRPESLIAYEVGVKTQPSRAIAFDAAAFYYDFTDVQTNLLDGTLVPPLQRLANIDGKSKLYGVEASGVVRPFEGLTIQSAVGWLDSELATFATGPVPFVGNRFSNAPSFTFNAVARYETPAWNNGLKLILQADTNHESFAFKDASNNRIIVQQPYWLYNARVAIATEDKRWELALWGKNLSDEQFTVSGGDTSGFGTIGLTTNNPRTYGLSLSWRR